jgi:hypothetical protein
MFGELILFFLTPHLCVSVIQGMITKCAWEKSGVSGGYVEVIAIGEICEESISIWFVSEGQVTQPALSYGKL